VDVTVTRDKPRPAAIVGPPPPIRVLVVDDDEDDFLLTRDLLDEAAPETYKLRHANTYDHGLAAFGDAEFDVALIDYRLGGQTGIELIRQVSDGDNVVLPPIILLTGEGDSETDRAAMKAGASDFLNKSTLEPAILERSIRYAIALRRGERERAKLAEARIARREAEARRQQAEDANNAKDAFLAMLSHELRTPLNAVLGWVQLLRMGDNDAETRKEALQAIERNAQAQAQLVADLLDVSRIVVGKVQLELADCDLIEVAEAAMDACRPAAREKNVELAFAGDPPDHPAPLRADASRLRQVFWNLLNNAIKFTPGGGRIDFKLAARPGGYVVTVRDTGEGIDADTLPHVFERFRQADGSHTRRKGGLGLGLSLVRHLTELHGGTVLAESPGPGGGSTFTVTLPRQTPAAAPDKVRNPFDRPLRGLRLVLVEDEPDTRLVMGKMLEKLGCAVVACDGGEEALEYCTRALSGEEPPHVVLSDIAMPGLDGYDLLRRLRAVPGGGDVKVFALTAFASPENRSEALAAGFDAHLAKPLDADTLVKLLRTLLHATA
jgi:signal transduction histidine kinase